jgi:hypothetical protein
MIRNPCSTHVSTYTGAGMIIAEMVLITLLTAVQSLGLMELAGVSWINVRLSEERPVATFTLALLLLFFDPALSDEFRAGELRFWRDQARPLESTVSIWNQIVELHQSHMLGNLAVVRLTPSEGEAPMWMIKAHAGSDGERAEWMRSVITMEGRSPVG